MSRVTAYRTLAAIPAILLLGSAMIAAQWTAPLSGPVLGYVFDREAGRPRAVKGILGSATIGDPIDIGIAPSLFVTLDASRAIASSPSGLEILTLSLDAAQVSRTPIPGVGANPSRAFVSRQGTSAALYYSGAQQVQVVTGLPKDPRYSGLLTVDRPVLQMAVNDDGTLIVYAIAGLDTEELYVWTALSGNTRFLSTANSVSGIALTPNGDAVVSDRGANEVFAIWNAGNGAIRRLLASVEDGVSRPGGVAVSSGNRIYAANAGAATLLVFDLSGRLLKTHSCDCTISGLIPLRDSVFRLTDRVDRTTYLLDAGTAEERIVFVPPPME